MLGRRKALEMDALQVHSCAPSAWRDGDHRPRKAGTRYPPETPSPVNLLRVDWLKVRTHVALAVPATQPVEVPLYGPFRA